MQFSTGHPAVDAVGQLHFSGNVVHHSWYRRIRYSNKRGEFTDYVAVLILADIVYWYRPVEVRDEQSGHLLGYRKKFTEDKLQRSPEAFSELLCCSEKVAREALSVLESLGLIDIELRAIKTGFGVIPTAMFIGLNVQRLKQITQNTSKPESIEKSLLPISVRRNAEMGKAEYPNGQGEVPNSGEPLTEMGNSSLYRDFSETSHKNGECEEKSASQEEESEPSTNPSLLDQQNQPIDSRDSNVIREIKSSAGDCDNKPIRKPDGDGGFGAVRQRNYQRSLAAKIQQGNVIPISEYEIWESPAEYEEFEEYLLSQSSWHQNPASYVAKKLKAIATGAEPATELKQWRKDRQEAATALTQPSGQPQQLTQEEQDAEARFLAEMRSPDFHAHLRRPSSQQSQTQETTDARPQSVPPRSSLRSRLFS